MNIKKIIHNLPTKTQYRIQRYKKRLYLSYFIGITGVIFPILSGILFNIKPGYVLLIAASVICSVGGIAAIMFSDETLTLRNQYIRAIEDKLEESDKEYEKFLENYLEKEHI